jgi:predicted acylesterase/phospholipase RssA
MQTEKRPKIAVALPGCAGGAVACMGILDELKANNIPIDMISSCSSTSILACAYASGNVEALRQRTRDIGKLGFLKLFSPSFHSGMFSLRPVEKELAKIVPLKNIEELNIPVAIVASDIVSGKEVCFTSGSIFKAVEASCAYPGLFEPVIDGNKVLVDGGLFSVIPTKAAYDLGADLVIGVEMYNQRYIFIPPLRKIKSILNDFKSFIGTHIGSIVAFREEHSEHRKFGFFRVLGASIDYAIEEHKKPEEHDCDLLIDFNVRGMKEFEFTHADDLYNQGRRVAKRSMPAIKELLASGRIQTATERTPRSSEHPEYLEVEAIEEVEI